MEKTAIVTGASRADKGRACRDVGGVVSESHGAAEAVRGDAALSRARLRDCPFPAQDSGGRRQFHLLWWQALGLIFAEEHSNVFVYEPGVIIGSHDNARFEAQRCIGKRLYDHTVSMKASGRRLRKDGDPQVVRY
jgi:hypothetical protein